MESSSSKSNKIIFRTARLYAFELTTKDTQGVYELNNDPEVMKYTGEPAFNSFDDARDFLANYDAYEKTQMGRWGLKLSSSYEFIGWCGLKLHANGEIDLGVRIKQSFWNEGFATEAAQASVEYGFDNFKVDYLIGRAMKDNIASIRVLEKIGMVFWKEVKSDLEDAFCYRIDRGDFRKSRVHI